jgi:hypothetical protein
VAEPARGHLPAKRLDPSILGTPVLALEEFHRPGDKLRRGQHPARVQQIIEKLTPAIPPTPDTFIELDIGQAADFQLSHFMSGGRPLINRFASV